MSSKEAKNKRWCCWEAIRMGNWRFRCLLVDSLWQRNEGKLSKITWFCHNIIRRFVEESVTAQKEKACLIWELGAEKQDKITARYFSTPRIKSSTLLSFELSALWLLLSCHYEICWYASTCTACWLRTTQEKRQQMTGEKWIKSKQMKKREDMREWEWGYTASFSCCPPSRLPFPCDLDPPFTIISFQIQL